uniref:Uncharacterized protein n=1 Tax=Fagus sylvatica TaxID=28930 RepID=A0A2N9GDM6_FAGSY
MTPGSWGAGAVFTCFSGEDSDKTGEAIGEPRVARRSWSNHLSNAPGPANQLVGPPECFWSVGGHFSDRNSGQTGENLDDPRVPHRACMCPLFNVLRLANQLVVSQEDSARKRGNVGGKVLEFSAQPYFVNLFSCAW